MTLAEKLGQLQLVGTPDAAALHRLHDFYLPPFKAAVEAGVSTVMTSFNAISGVPAHGNTYTVRDVLKGAYGFAGFVVSDYTGIQELIAHGLVAGWAGAATAGVDMDMVSINYTTYGAQHQITMDEIDDAVRRILLLLPLKTSTGKIAVIGRAGRPPTTLNSATARKRR